MKTQAILLRGLFVLVLGAVFATIGYFAYPCLFETLTGIEIDKAVIEAESNLTSQNMMVVWFAALGVMIGIGTLMCSVESTQKQVLFYFLALLTLGVGFSVVWAYFMQNQFAEMISINSSLGEAFNVVEFASFNEIPQFATVAVLVFALIIYIKKTKNH